MHPLVALCGDFNSRTGGLNDVAPNVHGKDTNDLIMLNNTNSDLG